MLAKSIPFFGIPVLENLSKFLIIGHNFRKIDDEHKIDIFSYCLGKKRYVNLPKVTFCTLIISNYPDSNFFASLPFNYKLLGNGNPIIKLDTINNSLNPKCISLYLKDIDYRPIFLNQKFSQIEIEYVHCKCKKTCFVCKNKTVKISWKENKENGAECILFG
ncbi:hypothetical protein C1646_703768 [Rhizophagus diaphanus]|nr:hypothetical protein C1646_703768 [Rhizophagus diaphanus] [Rhizophagus sp. MUCL 43196]